MLRSLLCALMLALPTTLALAQLPHHSGRDSLGRKLSFQPYLGRIAVFNEFPGPLLGHTLNIEAHPLKGNLLDLNIRVGTTTGLGASAWSSFAMVYSLGAEFGRRRSRFTASAGHVTNYVLRNATLAGRYSQQEAYLDWFGSVGYRLQLHQGFFMGVTTYLVFPERDGSSCIICFGSDKGPKLYPSVQLGFRLPSTAQHRWYRQLTKADPAARDSLKQIHGRQRDVLTIPDSLRVPGTGSSEIGFSVGGTSLINVHYTFYAPFRANGVVQWYLRPGIGTVEPLLQFQLETGMAFLWKNTGFTIGGGGNAAVGVGYEAFIVSRGKVALYKGLSASLGVSLTWSEQAPFFTYVPKRSGIGWVMPSVGVAYRWPKRSY
jgi:hypothetical protein